MIFIDNTHEQLFYDLVNKMNAAADTERQALAYLIALDEDCSKNINQIYSFTDQSIKPDCLMDDWQTSTSIKTLRLAFNLYSSGLMWCEEDQRKYVTPSELFCCSYAPYYFEAIKIRYPQYT